MSAAALFLLLLLQPADTSWERVRATIVKYLGRPYVWGASGLKSFDCSGFVWRVWTDSGGFWKRTTARKLYLSMPPAAKGDEFAAGNLVFFSNLTHLGIVNSGSDFFHAQTSAGTNLSRFDPYWRRRIAGFRKGPKAAAAP